MKSTNTENYIHNTNLNPGTLYVHTTEYLSCISFYTQTDLDFVVVGSLSKKSFDEKKSYVENYLHVNPKKPIMFLKQYTDINGDVFHFFLIDGKIAAVGLERFTCMQTKVYEKYEA